MINPGFGHALLSSWAVILHEIQRVFPEAVIAGGCLRDDIIGKPVKDIDIFVKARGDMLGELAKVYGGAVQENPQDVKQYHEQLPELRGVYRLITPPDQGEEIFGDISVSDDEGHPVQIIALNMDVTPQSVVDRMDFGICRVAHNGRDLLLTPEFCTDRVCKTFTLLRAHAPGKSLARFKRLREKYEGWKFEDPRGLLDQETPFL